MVAMRWFEKGITLALIVMMALVLLLSTVDLGWTILKDILSPPTILLNVDQLVDIFGSFMLVLIGIELLETIKAYLDEHIIHAEIVLEVAIIAIVRKVIILDIKKEDSLTLIGIAAIILALAAAFLLSSAPSTPATAPPKFPGRTDWYQLITQIRTEYAVSRYETRQWRNHTHHSGEFCQCRRYSVNTGTTSRTRRC